MITVLRQCLDLFSACAFLGHLKSAFSTRREDAIDTRYSIQNLHLGKPHLAKARVPLSSDVSRSHGLSHQGKLRTLSPLPQTCGSECLNTSKNNATF